MESAGHADFERQEESTAQRRHFALVATAAFTLLTLPRLLLHELWRDEAWLWLVVTESRAFADLFEPLSRSGQGYLFPMLCFAASRLSTSPVALQILHLIIAGAAAFAFARWAPLRRPERALFLLGYFPFYEYAVISRHYALGALLLWLALAAARARRPAIALGAALGLLCQTTVYGVILAVALAACFLIERWLRRGIEFRPVPRVEATIGFALALAGLIAGMVQLVPAPGTSFVPGWRFGWDPAHGAEVLSIPWRAFVPLPRAGLNFWNSNFMDSFRGAQPLLGLASLALATAILWRQRLALIMFVIGSTGLLVFSYIKYAGLLRHQGHLWLLFAAAIWVGGGETLARRSWRTRAFITLLVVHLLASAWASWTDLRHPFSHGEAAAELIRSSGLDRYPMLGHREPPAATVSLFLGKPLYAPSREVFAMYPDWGPRQREISQPELRCSARDLAHRSGTDVVLVINYQLPRWEEVMATGAVTGAIHPTEDYFIYRMHHSRLAATRERSGCP